ncbi:MAG: adenylate/guanylate cyclase domain-containing protein [Timaviella obliquedivisa GSE-PSE-MK23-08B]|nr:adenylate/guanylate cyclase domain-containing protein [Timaviella obliquedivisa GSE-PSE-MK23-08B]
MRLLKKRLAHPEWIEAIDAQIQKKFVETHAILILDMSGFSRLVEEFFIIHTLAQIQQMRGVVVPAVEAHRGEILKLEADNVYAIFPQVHQAVVAATQMIQQLAQVGIHASIGIGYGELIMIANDKASQGSKDAFGNQMNLASKLGEDLAKPDEILLTEAAFQQITAPTAHWQLEEMQVSNLKLQVWRSPQPPLTGGISTTSSPA